jgi:hypothetical protein
MRLAYVEKAGLESKQERGRTQAEGSECNLRCMMIAANLTVQLAQWVIQRGHTVTQVHQPFFSTGQSVTLLTCFKITPGTGYLITDLLFSSFIIPTLPCHVFCARTIGIDTLI